MLMKRLRKLTSMLLSLSMLAGYVQVRAEDNMEPEEPETEVLVTEEPAEETDEPVIEVTPEETPEPEAPAEEPVVPEETVVPEEPAEPEAPAEEQAEEAVPMDDSTLESITFPETEMNLLAGDEEVRSVTVLPAGFDPALITAVSGNEDVVTVEPVEGEPYSYRITAVSGGTAKITFSAKGSDQKAECTVNVEEPHISIPEEITFQDGSYAPWPIENNIPNLRIVADVSPRGTPFSIDGDNIEQNLFPFELMPYDGDEASFPVTFTAYDKTTDEKKAEFSTTVHIGKYLKYSEEALVFKGETADPQTFTLTASGPYEGKDITIENPESETGNVIWTAEQTGGSGSNTKTFRITPKRIGTSALIAKLPDLNGTGRPVSIPLTNVFVTNPDAPEDFGLYRPGWEPSEQTRITELFLDWGMERGVTAVTAPELSDPSAITAKSSDSKLVSVTKDPSDPYTYKIKAAQTASGTAEVTFTCGEKTVILPVTVHRFIDPAESYVRLIAAGDPDRDKVTVPITVREPASTVELKFAVEKQFGVPFESEDQIPVSVELNKVSDTQYECVITPLFEGGALVRLYTEGIPPFGDEFAQTAIWASCGEKRKLEWHEEMLEGLGRDKGFDSTFTLNLKQSDAVIEYALLYYDDKEAAEAAKGSPVPKEEWKVYDGHAVRIESGSTKKETYGRIVAEAHKDGWADADKIDELFKITFDMHIDPLLVRYMEMNDLDINAIKDELIVLHEDEEGNPVEGVPENVIYTGSPIKFNEGYSDDMAVFYGPRRLTENVDYKVSYANNTNPAAATAKKAPTVKITGIGKYAKTWIQKFTIEKSSLIMMSDWLEWHPVLALEFNEADKQRVVCYTNSSKAPAISMSPYLQDTRHTAMQTQKTVSIKKGTDYEVWYYPVTGGDEGHWEVDLASPVKTLEKKSGKYVYAIFALPKSKKISGTKEEFEAGGYLEKYLEGDALPVFEVIDTTENPVIDLSKVKLSKNLGTLDLEEHYDGSDSCYRKSDVTGKFTGADPEIKLTSGNRRLIVSDSDSDPDADVRIRTLDTADVVAGTNYLLLEPMDKDDPEIKGTRVIKYTVRPVTAISSKTVKVTGLVKSLKLDNYDFADIWADGPGGLDLAKFTDPNSDGIKLVTKKGGQVIDPQFYVGPQVTSVYTGGTGSITLTFFANIYAGYDGSISVKIPVQIPTLAELKTAGKIRAEFVTPEGPKETVTAQYSQSGAIPQVRLVYKPENGNEFYLSEGTDYKLSYSNNKAVTTGTKKASVTFTGMGWFKGTLKNELQFDIVPANVNEFWNNRIEVKSADIVYNAKGKAGYFRSAPKIYDGTKVLKAGKDYKVLSTRYFYVQNVTDDTGKVIHVVGEEVQSFDNPLPGTYLAVDQKIQLLNPKYTSNMPGEEPGTMWIHANYRMITKAMNIASAKVVVNGGKAVYLGSDWEVTPEIQVILKKADVDPETKKKVDRILNPEDYEIISIDKNWLPGTATMVIKGKGDYAGTKKVTFKITKTPLVK